MLNMFIKICVICSPKKYIFLCNNALKIYLFLLILNYQKWKYGNVLFNDALNTVYLQLYGIGDMVKDHSAREETCCCHYMGYSF